MAHEVHEEDVLYDLRDYIKANLGTYLNGIAALKGDGLDLPKIKEFAIGEADVIDAARFPVCGIFPEDIEIAYLTTVSSELKGVVTCVLGIKGGKTDNLPLKVLRYAAAFRQLFDADRTAGATVDHVQVDRVRFYQRAPGLEDRMFIEVILGVAKEISH